MPRKKSRTPASAAAPLTFDLPKSLVARIESIRSGYDLKTASEAVRLAISRFDIGGFEPETEEHVQISVRISGDERRSLKTSARQKKVSVGAILRAALEALPVKRGRRR